MYCTFLRLFYVLCVFLTETKACTSKLRYAYSNVCCEHIHFLASLLMSFLKSSNVTANAVD